MNRRNFFKVVPVLTAVTLFPNLINVKESRTSERINVKLRKVNGVWEVVDMPETNYRYR
jgi:hypothetical protein